MEVTNNNHPSRSTHLIAEIDPPKGTNLESFLTSALNVRGRVETVRVTDSEHAIMRMSPLAPCLALKEKGVAPSMVINGRDRNRISFQADLLCAAALGINDIVIKEGQDAKEGDQPMARTSGDLDLADMLKCAAALNNGKDLAGEALDGATDFNIGVCIEPSDDVNFNRERIARYAEKIGKDEGANLAVILCAAYLNDIGLNEAEQKHGSDKPAMIKQESLVIATSILNNLKAKEEVLQDVCSLIKSHNTPEASNSAESSILNDAQLAASLEEQHKKNPFESQALEEIIAEQFLTNGGRQVAEATFKQLGVL